ncbi:MAG TPA: transglycosylase domain-containing protein [Xanthobacteraceae bacterium]|nr:transglycosylase domain-containing protein [Xanthobacteraceae bacterium]
MPKFAHILVKAIAALLVGSISALFGFVGFTVWRIDAQLSLPSYSELTAISAANPICSSNGERIFIPFAAIPPTVRYAFLAAEEPDFFIRQEINILTDLARAALLDQRPGHSAISSMVVRCIVSSKRDSHVPAGDWHVGNAVLFTRVEAAVSKDTIFDVYMNEIWLGRGAYGAGAAAYFGKSLAELNLDEAAFLAGLVRQPSLVRRGEKASLQRRNFVLDRMRQAGMISAEEVASAKEQSLILRSVSGPG